MKIRRETGEALNTIFANTDQTNKTGIFKEQVLHIVTYIYIGFRHSDVASYQSAKIRSDLSGLVYFSNRRCTHQESIGACYQSAERLDKESEYGFYQRGDCLRTFIIIALSKIL